SWGGNTTNQVPNIVLRGISSSVRNAGFEPGLGVYVDGVFMGRPESFNQNLADIAQVEVLRGPQGTLFGKNTIAGAINITTIRPNFDGVQGSIEAEYGYYDAIAGRGYISGPLVEGFLAAKLAVSGISRSGYVENLFYSSPGRRDRSAGAEGNFGGRLQFLA